MSKHTPGPWRVFTATPAEINADPNVIPSGARHYSGDYIAVLGSDGSVVCDNAGYYAQPITKEDARLIAQAPRLLEALEECICAIQQLQYDHGTIQGSMALSFAEEVYAEATKGE